MTNCSFCQNEIKEGKGILFVRADGSALIFCSSKCKKNALKLKRTARKLKWTKAFVMFKEQEAKKDNNNQ